MQTTPIIVPVTPSDDTCPSCNKEKEVVVTCKHCGYEYPEDDVKWWHLGVGIAIILIAIWIAVVLIIWISDGSDTLLEIILSQYEYLKELRLW